MIKIKSPVTWIGNKTSILHILYALFPIGCDRYVEPFGGSGAVLLGKPVPDKFEVFNDYNHNLVNLFRCMDKATGKPFLVNGKEVTSKVTFTAEKKDGEITVRFTFDGSAVTKQTDIVVFEALYRDDVEIAAHADIEDGGQTVTLTPPAPPVPQTGDNSNLGFWIGLGAVALGGIIAVVIICVKSRKDEDDE